MLRTRRHDSRSIGPLGPLAVIVVLLVTLLGACSDDDDDNEARPGPATKATGPPIVVGLINMEGAPLASFPEYRVGAEAAARYVNEELNGVKGRPIELDTCVTNGSPESSQACANRLRGRSPVAVLGGLDVGAAASLEVLEEAGIPYLAGAPLLGEELTSDGAFALSGGTAADLLGQAFYITDTLEAESMGVVHVDVPGLLSTAVLAARVILRSQGVEDLKVVAEESDAADFTPALSAVSDDDPEVIAAVFPAQGCARVMQAKQSLALGAKMFYPSACAAQSVIEAGGAGAEDAYFAVPFLPFADRSDPEVATYLDKIEAYGDDDASPSILSQGGFSLVMNLHELLGAVEGPLDPNTLRAEVASSRDRRSFMGHPYTCDGDQVPLLISVCSAHVRIVQYRSGEFHDVVGDWVTGAELVREFTN